MIIRILYILFISNSLESKLIRKDLFTKHCYSLPESAKKDRYIGIKQAFRAFKILWKREYVRNNEHSKNCLYVIFKSDISSKKQYIENQSGIKTRYGIYKNNILSNSNVYQKIIYSLLFIISFFLIIPIILFKSKNRIQLALLPEHIVGILIISNKLIKANCKNLYFFHTHEPEANLLSKILMLFRINVIKIPNSNPLFMYNKNILANEIILTLQYQKEELAFYNKFTNNNIKYWHPQFLENFYNKNSNNNNNNKSIAYYSHASWIRIKEDHNIPYFNECAIEINLLDKIKKSNFFKNKEIYICLHPKEKSSLSTLEKSYDYYKNIFGENISFMGITENTYSSFNKFNVGFGAFSSILIERIHCGYKTILFTQNLDEFPLNKSKFRYFSTNNILEFEDKINIGINMECDIFFQNHFLYTYRGI